MLGVLEVDVQEVQQLPANNHCLVYLLTRACTHASRIILLVRG